MTITGSGIDSPTIKTFDLLDQILTVLGSTTTTFWPFVEGGSLAASEIVRSYGESVHIFTMTDPGSLGFMPYRHIGGVNSYHFDKTDSMNGAGEDSTDFSFGNGTVDSAFSCGAWVNRDVAGAIQAILAKYDVAGTLREWQLTINASNDIEFEINDESATGDETASGDTQLTLNTWQLVVATYDGTEATPAINLCLDGASDNDGSSTETGAYVAMENTTTPLMLGAADDTAAPTIEMDGRIALPFICGKELSAANVTTIYNIGRILLGIA